MTTKKEHRDSIIAAGRASLKAWLIAAEKHGTIYYEVTNVAKSGMSRRIVLQTIRTVKGKPALWNLFPTLSEDGADWRTHSTNLDMVAKDLGYSFKFRAFVVGGCGMDMVFALIDNLAHLAGINAKDCDGKRSSYANRVRHESFS